MSKYLYSVEIERWVKMPSDKKKEIDNKNKGTGIYIGDDEGQRSEMFFTANNMTEVWERVKDDEGDLNVNILSIKRLVPVLCDLGKEGK